MEEFKSRMMRVVGDAATMLEPKEFSGRVTEAKLEEWLIANPELAGEQLLVLGSQLAEFAEDKDRLDVLALDRYGEIVLLELKVDGAFRLTDLQALAYAAGYSSLPPSHFVELLRRRLDKESNPESTSTEDARARIAEFVDVVDEFDEWSPSRRVRIKLVAPDYPKRVLNTVKWLGDVYGMPIEAIQCQLFEDANGTRSLTFERLLPLKSDDVFDLTVKAAEERKAGTSLTPRRPAILKTLLEHGLIADGQELWLHPNVLPNELKHVFDSSDARFRVHVDLSDGKTRFRWDPGNGQPAELLPPSLAWFSILAAVIPGRYTKAVNAQVFDYYSIEAGGKTLGEIAIDAGVW
jgi:hypothetical protein